MDVSYMIEVGNPCGIPVKELSAEIQWRKTWGGAIKVDGCSVPGQVRGNNQVQIESEAISKVERRWSNSR